MIWFSKSIFTHNENIRFAIIYISDYKKTSNLENQIHCDHNTQKQEGKVCIFSADSLGNCSPEKTKGKYGYPERRPCVFLKLNKVTNYG